MTPPVGLGMAIVAPARRLLCRVKHESTHRNAGSRAQPRRVCLVPSAAVIVAHPDDETLWCGGWILDRPDWEWFVLTLCRGGDRDRAGRFARVLTYLGATGAMCDLDDGPAQEPLDAEQMNRAILETLPRRRYGLLLTHGPRGEYTRHRRHEECSRAVVSLFRERRIEADELKLFAYRDEGPGSLPRVAPDAHEQSMLSPETFERKLHVMTELYGFDPTSWEARATPRVEGFYRARPPAGLT
jgi:LmbE family N-acetylglucosaminyl deacetylase